MVISRLNIIVLKNIKSIITLLEEQREITNLNEVNIYLMDDGTIYTCCSFPKFDNSKERISLELTSKHKTSFAFLSYYDIETIQDVENLMPEIMLKHYVMEKGVTDVICDIDDPYLRGTLRFRKMPYGLFVKDENSEQEHQLKISLLEPEEFVAFTCKYILLQDIFEPRLFN